MLGAMNHALAADLIAGVHLSTVVFVIVMQLAVLIGWPLRWRNKATCV